MILEPFYFEPSWRGVTDPAEQALREEGYSVDVYRRAPLADAPTVTLGRFEASSNAGVLVIDAHGYIGRIVVETYGTEAARNAAFATYLRKGWTRDELVMTQSKLDGYQSYRISITARGIEHHWHGRDSFVYEVGCFSSTLAAAFLHAGARAVFAYVGKKLHREMVSDFRTFWTRLDGTAYPDADLTQNRTRDVSAAYSDCQQHGECKGADLVGEPLVLAPAVRDRSPMPERPVQADGQRFPVTVTFDAEMKQESPTSILSVSGCAVQTVGQPAWQGTDGLQIQGSYRIMSAGQLTITVHASSAVSADNGVELDGSGTGQAAVGPNGDDFVWKVPCQAPKVHIVFAGSGTAERSTRSDTGNGFVTTTSGTDKVSWTAIYNLDLREIAGTGQPAGPYLQGDTFDPAASSLTGTSSSATVVDECPTDQCSTSPPCSGSFSGSHDPNPDLYAYSPPAADGTVKILLPPYFVLESSSNCGPAALRDTCDPLLAGTPGSGSSPTAGIGPLTATITINPKTWKPGSMSVQPVAPITWSCQSSDGKLTDTGSVTWSGTVTLSVPSTG